MKIYHINDSNIKIRTGTMCPQKYWGGMLTNKAMRTERDYALLIDPNGERIYVVTEATFKMLAKGGEHVYPLSVIKSNFFEKSILPLVSRFNKVQVRTMLQVLMAGNENVINDCQKGENTFYIRLKEDKK